MVKALLVYHIVSPEGKVATKSESDKARFRRQMSVILLDLWLLMRANTTSKFPTGHKGKARE